MAESLASQLPTPIRTTTVRIDRELVAKLYTVCRIRGCRPSDYIESHLGPVVAADLESIPREVLDYLESAT
jgi:hypothetical protein